MYCQQRQQRRRTDDSSETRTSVGRQDLRDAPGGTAPRQSKIRMETGRERRPERCRKRKTGRRRRPEEIDVGYVEISLKNRRRRRSKSDTISHVIHVCVHRLHSTKYTGLSAAKLLYPEFLLHSKDPPL